jgi:hypothetical protein
MEKKLSTPHTPDQDKTNPTSSLEAAPAPFQGEHRIDYSDRLGRWVNCATTQPERKRRAIEINNAIAAYRRLH